MTRIQIRFTALIAAFALVIGCALAFAAPQQAHADTLVAGSSAAKAKLMDFSKKRSLSVTDEAYHNPSDVSKFYKFNTSGRNSSYRITLDDLDQQDMDVILYDSSNREIDRWNTEDRLRTTYPALGRNELYYVELRRDTARVSRADYSITISEVITPPNPIKQKKFKVKSNSKGKITVSYNRPSTATGFQIKTQRAWGDQTKATTFKTTKTKATYTTNFRGKKHPYEVSVRPYRKINGKFYYGEWSDPKTIKVK